MRNIRSPLPQIERPLPQLGALLINGTVALPPVPPPAPVPIAPVPVAVIALAVTNGKSTGFPFGVIVVFPITISGASADSVGAGVMVEEPLNVAVKVVKTSVSVVVRTGAVDVGLVVGAKVVDMAASATPE